MADDAPKYDHAWDLENLAKYHVPQSGTTEGGACLNRHVNFRECRGPGGFYNRFTCNHRWQAFERALEDKNIYNGNGQHQLEEKVRWYDPYLARPGAETLQRLMRRIGKNGGIKRGTMPAPRATGDWDIGEGNASYARSSNFPILHEAHHIVAAAELRNAIAKKIEGKPQTELLVKRIRRGLLEAKYNLNHKENMIILPIEARFARAMGLPRHRRTKNTPHHQAYSDYIQELLRPALAPIQAQKNCDEVSYSAAKERVEHISESVRTEIVQRGRDDRGRSLDQLFRMDAPAKE